MRMERLTNQVVVVVVVVVCMLTLVLDQGGGSYGAMAVAPRSSSSPLDPVYQQHHAITNLERFLHASHPCRPIHASIVNPASVDPVVHDYTTTPLGETPTACPTSLVDRLFWPHPVSHVRGLVSKGTGFLHIQRNNTQSVHGLYTVEEQFRLVQTQRMSYKNDKDILVVLNGLKVLDSPYPARVGDILSRISVSKASMVLNALHHKVPRLKLICQHLEEAFSVFSSANSYLTPSNSRGFGYHYDTEAVILFQLEGTKYWDLFYPVGEATMFPKAKTSSYTHEELSTNDNYKYATVVMRAGDALVLPQGVLHRGHTTEEPSFHVTFSLDMSATRASDGIASVLSTLSHSGRIPNSITMQLTQLLKEVHMTSPALRHPLHLFYTRDVTVASYQPMRRVWDRALSALRSACWERRETCSRVEDEHFQVLRKKDVFRMALMESHMRLCGGTLSRDADVYSLDNINQLSMRSVVYRLPMARVCLFQNKHFMGDHIPLAISINSMWQQSFDGDVVDAIKYIQSFDYNEEFRVKDVPYSDALNLLGFLIEKGALAISTL